MAALPPVLNDISLKTFSKLLSSIFKTKTSVNKIPFASPPDRYWILPAFKAFQNSAVT